MGRSQIPGKNKVDMVTTKGDGIVKQKNNSISTFYWSLLRRVGTCGYDEESTSHYFYKVLI